MADEPMTIRLSDAGLLGIANSPAMTAALHAVAAKGEAFAKSISPYDADDDGDHYRDDFEIRDTTIKWEGEYPGDRAAAELANTSGHAMAVEYGYRGRSDRPGRSPHRVLGRTLEYLIGEARA